jgi:hypothetical protein
MTIGSRRRRGVVGRRWRRQDSWQYLLPTACPQGSEQWLATDTALFTASALVVLPNNLFRVDDGHHWRVTKRIYRLEQPGLPILERALL